MDNTEKIKETTKFFKDAFCVDGEVKIISGGYNNLFKINAVIELNDSTRGRFYVAQVSLKENRMEALLLPELPKWYIEEFNKS